MLYTSSGLCHPEPPFSTLGHASRRKRGSIALACSLPLPCRRERPQPLAIAGVPRRVPQLPPQLLDRDALVVGVEAARHRRHFGGLVQLLGRRGQAEEIGGEGDDVLWRGRGALGAVPDRAPHATPSP